MVTSSLGLFVCLDAVRVIDSLLFIDGSGIVQAEGK
jgi:hypothetical protein